VKVVTNLNAHNILQQINVPSLIKVTYSMVTVLEYENDKINTASKNMDIVCANSEQVSFRSSLNFAV
jgi:hypothetical protein